MQVKHIVFETSWGWVGVERSEIGLRRVILPREDAACVQRLLVPNGTSVPEDTLLALVRDDFLAYFSGCTKEFDYTFDLSGCTEFQKITCEIVSAISYGETQSYLWVANRIGNGHLRRAVGNALRCNPLPIVIPCHRIIRSDGTTGGYVGGVWLKENLLLLEKEVLLGG